MKADVYQSKRPTFVGRMEGSPITPAALAAEFEHVATVSFDPEWKWSEEEFLEYAYEQTNNLGQSWWDNESVQVHKQARSTSVGDIVVLEDEAGASEAYSVALVGWNKLKKQ